jgi:CubicO group peptidase (beta-lactamase class C family)
LDHTEFDLTVGFPAGSLTRCAAMRGISAEGLATALDRLAGFDEDRAAAQSGEANPVATPVLRPTLFNATLRDFETDVEAAVQTFRVPGAAVALVHGGGIIFNRGFGVCNAESGDAATGVDTLRSSHRSGCRRRSCCTCFRPDTE